MHQLAIALKQKGHHVTGSDDEIFDPARTHLQQNQLMPEQLGWFPNKIQQLDAVVLGMHAKPDNPELLQAQKQNIPIYSYPEYIYNQSKQKKRIVIAGSHGKTTTTAMIMHVLKQCQIDFDYLVGAKLEGFQQTVKITNAPIIIIEGDEYLASPIHQKPKIHYYKPHIAVLTGIDWDHINVFPTLEQYVQQFEIFVQQHIETNGTLIFNPTDNTVAQIAQNAKHLTIIPYQTTQYSTENGNIRVWDGEKNISLQIFGQHNQQNMEAAHQVCQTLGINSSNFYNAMQSFKGAAKRLELFIQNEHFTVFKDFAHAPSKVKASTKALKKQNNNRQLIACLELHTYSSLNINFLPQYQNTLDDADIALVLFDPHALSIKKLPDLDTNAVKKAFNNPKLIVFDHPDKLEKHLKTLNFANTNVLLMSSGNFGGINWSKLFQNK